MGAPVQIGKGDGIGVDVTAAGSALNRHVAEGHPLLHRQRFNRGASKFIGVAHTPFHPQGANDVQHQILGIDPRLQPAVHPDAAHLELAHRQALASQHIPHLAGANAESDRPKGPMG